MSFVLYPAYDLSLKILKPKERCSSVSYLTVSQLMGTVFFPLGVKPWALYIWRLPFLVWSECKGRAIPPDISLVKRPIPLLWESFPASKREQKHILSKLHNPWSQRAKRFSVKENGWPLYFPELREINPSPSLPRVLMLGSSPPQYP